jgi:hypothetical protein
MSGFPMILDVDCSIAFYPNLFKNKQIKKQQITKRGDEAFST